MQNDTIMVPGYGQMNVYTTISNSYRIHNKHSGYHAYDPQEIDANIHMVIYI